MGFYGNVFYQLANAFGKFIIKNSGIVSEKFPESIPDSNITPAIGLDASYNFDTGNKWIRLKPDAANATVEIYHSPIMDSTNTNNFQTFTPLGTQDENIVPLTAGECIEIPVIDYDSAGHVLGIKTTNTIRLPISTVESDISQIKEDMKSVMQEKEKISTLIEKVEDLEDATSFIGRKTLFTTNNSSKTITSSLGSMDDLGSYYKKDKAGYKNQWDEKPNTLNISKAILNLDERLAKIENLETRLSNVEFIVDSLTDYHK